MKCVISGEELKNVMKEGVDLLCNTVTATLGPTGNNVLINNSDTTPFITNDGVTIASNIESSDPRINTILEIVKEASLKTNELVGDGTTTTLVLLESIFNLGLEAINNGVNPIELKNNLSKTLDKLLIEIDKYKMNPRDKDYKTIATISSNDTEIGEITSNIFSKVKSKYACKLEESSTEETYFKINKGYNIPIRNISNLYFKNQKNIELDNVSVLVLKGYLNSLEEISEVINTGLDDKNILIFVEEMEESIKQELLVYYLTNNKNIFIVELEEYGTHREKIEEDISILCDCIIKNVNYEPVNISDLGLVKSISINNEDIILSVDNNRSNELVKIIKEELGNTVSEYEKEFIRTRLSKLEEGIATIYVGGKTKTEKRERLMRFEDALCALEVSKNGVVYGEGITYLKIRDVLNNEDTSDSIMFNSLEKPLEKVLSNLGLDNNIKKDIINSNYNKIYDCNSNSLIDIDNCNILDPIDVVKVALKNSISIASLLLTTSSLVINENDKLEKDII